MRSCVLPWNSEGSGADAFAWPEKEWPSREPTLANGSMRSPRNA